MRVILHTVSDIAHYFGSARIAVQFEGEMVAEFLEFLDARYGFNLRCNQDVMLFINGCGCTKYLRPLKEGDRVALVPVLAAG